MAKKFGVIGLGNMGGAIVKGALDKGVINHGDVCFFDPSEAAQNQGTDWGLKLMGNEEEVVKVSDIILLAVKPQQQEAVQAKMKDMEDKCMFSIVAGVSVERLRKAMTGNARILRLLPNTPALVYEGAFGICEDNDLREDEKDFAKDLFGSIGSVVWVSEYDIDAVCGLSGGGPSYVAMFIEALADGGVRMGLKRDVAYRLAEQTVYGTAKLMMEKDLHPGVLKDMVTSPAGTTIEGNQVLEESGFRGAVMECVVQATLRSREL